MYKEFGISEEIENLANIAEKDLKEEFYKIDLACMKNSLNVLQAFQKNKIAEVHFNSTTGYGYDDIGRDTIEKVFADVLKAEETLVRTQFISGTHAITVALFACLRPGDTMLSICSKPYDTLDSIIGIQENPSSLKSYQVGYEQIDLVDNNFDIPKIVERLSKKDVKLVEIQRSRGYALRKSLTIEKIEKVIKAIREVNQDVIIMVDNCYGEFVQEKEPIECGADIIVRLTYKKFRRWISTKWSIYSRKERFSRTLCRKINSSWTRKRSRTNTWD